MSLFTKLTRDNIFIIVVNIFLYSDFNFALSSSLFSNHNLVAFNPLSNSILLSNATTKKKNLPNFGPLIIYSNYIRSQGNNTIFPVSSKTGNLFYIAINCPKRLINVTSSDLSWLGWEMPRLEFEKIMVDYICNHSIKIVDN
ncbi:MULTISPECIES: hypothetical protein [Prochlorococcus]|uniref:hypothetical protein n=1 Tax=Prochlorococcus TaxID=1218 RepID=UPI000561BD4E|nr:MULTISPECIES: hypothetical protein [Prochlorococcus]